MSEVLRTFGSDGSEFPAHWRSRNKPTVQLQRSRSVYFGFAFFLLYPYLVKFASIHILASAPFCRRYVPQPRSDQHHSGVAIRKTADNSRSTAYLFHDPLQAIISPQTAPVLIGKIHVCRIKSLQRFSPRTPLFCPTSACGVFPRPETPYCARALYLPVRGSLSAWRRHRGHVSTGTS